jgi:hypothetical protein
LHRECQTIKLVLAQPAANPRAAKKKETAGPHEKNLSWEIPTSYRCDPLHARMPICTDPYIPPDIQMQNPGKPEKVNHVCAADGAWDSQVGAVIGKKVPRFE